MALQILVFEAYRKNDMLALGTGEMKGDVATNILPLDYDGCSHSQYHNKWPRRSWKDDLYRLTLSCQ